VAAVPALADDRFHQLGPLVAAHRLEPGTDLGLRYVGGLEERAGEHRGHGRLLVNGREVGAGEIPRTIPAVIETSGEGQCCGYDSGLPVTEDYDAPFRFTGLLRQVVVEVEPGPGEDFEAQVRAAFTDH
jgi:hypothetical protein